MILTVIESTKGEIMENIVTRENSTAWVASVENAIANARYHLEQAVDAAKAASAIITNAEQDGEFVLQSLSDHIDRLPSDLKIEMTELDNLLASIERHRSFYIKTGEAL